MPPERDAGKCVYHDGIMEKLGEIMRTFAFGARSYTFDAGREAMRKYYDLRNTAIALSRDMKAAQGRGDWQSADKLEARLLALQGEMKHLQEVAQREGVSR